LIPFFLKEPPKLPVLHSPPAIEIPQLPTLPGNDEPVLHKLPRRSSSLRLLTDQRPSLPVITPTPSQTQFPTQSTALSPDFLLPVPDSGDSARSSWTSVSSAGSLPSPLFDSAIFDAFPSVPGTTPAPPLSATLPQNASRMDKYVPMSASAASSFDSALLSSAIHLVASSNQRAPSPVVRNPPSSSRSATPTPMGRMSVDTARAVR